MPATKRLARSFVGVASAVSAAFHWSAALPAARDSNDEENKRLVSERYSGQLHSHILPDIGLGTRNRHLSSQTVIGQTRGEAGKD